jgi:hypothetical protein
MHHHGVFKHYYGTDSLRGMGNAGATATSWDVPDLLPCPGLEGYDKRAIIRDAPAVILR